MLRPILTLLTTICLSLTITSCYHPTIQQGNVITPEAVAQLKRGMTKAQVFNLMGTPVLMDAFHKNRWLYVYTLLPKKGKYENKRVTVYFSGDRVIDIMQEGDNNPTTQDATQK